MAGLVTQTAKIGMGAGLTQGFTFRSYSTGVTIAKPYGCTMLVIECVGSGGGGGGGDGSSGGAGGGGGGHHPARGGGGRPRGRGALHILLGMLNTFGLA